MRKPFAFHKLPADIAARQGLAGVRDTGSRFHREGPESLPLTGDIVNRPSSSLSGRPIDPLRVLVWSLLGVLVVGVWIAIIWFAL